MASSSRASRSTWRATRRSDDDRPVGLTPPPAGIQPAGADALQLALGLEAPNRLVEAVQIGLAEALAAELVGDRVAPHRQRQLGQRDATGLGRGQQREAVADQHVAAAALEQLHALGIVLELREQAAHAELV